MMSNEIRTNLSRLLNAAILMGGLFSFSNPVFASAPNSFRIDISIPHQSLDFTDLDVRDEFNRPVTKSEDSFGFANFVSEKLNSMLMQNLTPAHQVVQKILNENWDAFSGWIKKAASRAENEVKAWLSSNKKMKWVVQLWSFDTTQKIISVVTQRSSFQYLICSLLSSIQLLR